VVPAVSGAADRHDGRSEAGHDQLVPQTARAAALEALLHVEQSSSFLRGELHSVFDRMKIEPRDRGLALQLAAGAIRHRRTLRLVLSHLRGDAGRAGSIQPNFLAILEIGAFQLLFLDRVPAYAAINEAVEAARRFAPGPRGKRTVGFINGMLRGLQRLIVGREPDGSAARDALPHPDGGIVRLREAVLPDARDSAAAFLGAAYSYPDWLVARWLTEHGDRTQEICRWGNRRPRIFARANPMRPIGDPASVPGLVPGPRAGSFDVSDIPQDRLEPLLAAGVLAVQDPSAMAAVLALAPQPGEAVLDLCASPGTKTMQIVEAMGDRGTVVACDRTEEKLSPVRRTVASRGLASVTVCLSEEVVRQAPQAGGAEQNVVPQGAAALQGATALPGAGVPQHADVPPGATGGLSASAYAARGFDGVLVDAPCSNTGVLARRPEARWRLRPEDLDELPPMQLELLTQAAALVRPGGRMVYSTCSRQREENDDVVGAFLKQHAAWRLVGSDHILPSADHDGAFWALLAR
jgi:16S rRNA (cytosine967-C5)-methyltransferase